MTPFLLLFVSNFLLVSSRLYFCNLNCGEEHLVCKNYRRACRPSIRCGLDEHGEMTQSDRKEILLTHNVLRNEMAQGESKWQNLTVANMNAMSYNMELEFVAQCWTNRCMYKLKACLSTSMFEEVGQNVLITRQMNPSHTAVTHWWIEREFINRDLINSYDSKENYRCGRASQVIWAETKYVGCGKTHRYGTFAFTCLYAPMGNVNGKPIFIIGEPCSKCPDECGKTYEGLCGKHYINDSFRPPFSMKGAGVNVNRYLILLLLIVWFHEYNY